SIGKNGRTDGAGRADRLRGRYERQGVRRHVETDRARHVDQRGSPAARRMGTGAPAMTGTLFAFLLLLAGQSSRYSLTDTEKIQRTLQFSGAANHMIELDNLSGAIHVVSTTGRSVEVSATRTIRAESQDRVVEAKRDVKLDISDNAETIRIYV